MWQELLESIPPDTLIGFLISVGGVFSTALVGGGYLFRRWFLSRLETERVKTKRDIDAAQAKQELDKSELQAKQELDKLELQNQLDQTQSSREMMRLQMSESSENRKAFLSQLEALRLDGQKRDSQYERHLQEITESYKGIQSNTAATLELLKEHQESDEIMGIKQEKVIAQNTETHSKLTDISSSVDALIIKVDNLVGNRAIDKKSLDDIHNALTLIQQGLQRLEEKPVAKPIAQEKSEPGKESVHET